MLIRCWTSIADGVYDARPTSNQHWVNNLHQVFLYISWLQWQNNKEVVVGHDSSRQRYILDSYSRRKALTQCWYKVGPPSTTPAWHYTTIGWRCFVFRDDSSRTWMDVRLAQESFHLTDPPSAIVLVLPSQHMLELTARVFIWASKKAPKEPGTLAWRWLNAGPLSGTYD